MKKLIELHRSIESGALNACLKNVCACGKDRLPAAEERLLRLVAEYRQSFGPDGRAELFSAPGRTELGGNHTDHQRGRVLAAAVNLDTVACAGPNGTKTVRIFSTGYPETTVDLGDLTPREGEKGTSAALVRGIAAYFSQNGLPVTGFNARISSEVPAGSGLSSSAAYEVLIGVIFNHLFCGDRLNSTQIGQAGQFAENRFFGKPCGLMDQLACSTGGIVSIDFQDPECPAVERLNSDPTAGKYALCIVDSGADHADLTGEYAAVPAEMKAVARFFGKDVLREVDQELFWQHIREIRAAAGDRAVLRAIHFFTDNELVKREAQALKKGDIPVFLSCVQASGRSSALYLQNLSCAYHPEQQALPVAIALAEKLLDGSGAVRVHGGGFAGTIQTYVPYEKKEEFRQGMETVFGGGCCHFLCIRPGGGTVLQ